jgi:hypothetical protein
MLWRIFRRREGEERRMIRRLVPILLGAVVISLLIGGIAVAASWQDIRDDLMDNGRLDGTYTVDELKNYLNNATDAEYNSIVQDRIDQFVSIEDGRDTFPFTGFQLMIAGIVVVVLVGGGIALRHFSRPQRS